MNATGKRLETAEKAKLRCIQFRLTFVSCGRAVTRPRKGRTAARKGALEFPEIQTIHSAITATQAPLMRALRACLGPGSGVRGTFMGSEQQPRQRRARAERREPFLVGLGV